ncbi:MAG: LysR family transcriptional regulator [Ruminococcaceae bacterium]|nr:LysR family transcriptional regulator [Oscillospiraceae bacterium]
MDTQKINVILSAVKQKSLSKAAEENSYTPSAMSHIADSLEKELGVKLLERTPRGVSLTSDGQILLPYLSAVVDAEKALLQAARSMIDTAEHHLRIGTFSSIAQHILPEIIGQFRKTYPNIKISVSVEDNLQDWLEKDLADVIFTDELTHGDNVWLPIREDPFVAVVPSTLLPQKRTVNREDLYPHTYISINEKALDTYFDQKRFANILQFESVDNVSVLYLIKEGIGFSVLPSLMVNQKIKDVRVVKLNPPISRTIGFAVKKNARHTYATQCFIEYLKLKKNMN